MRFARAVLAVLTVSLAAYGPDCLGMPAPKHAMGCCKKMRCHSRHQRNQNPQNCCDTTPQMRAALGQPPSPQTISVSPVMLGMMQTFEGPTIAGFFDPIFVGHSHDPPVSVSITAPLLRI